MALARPIVASASAAFRDARRRRERAAWCRRTTPARSPTAVIELLGDEGRRRRIGDAALARLTGTFSQDGFANTMFTAFGDAVRDGRP
jgi:hypothetical protein